MKAMKTVIVHHLEVHDGGTGVVLRNAVVEHPPVFKARDGAVRFDSSFGEKDMKNGRFLVEGNFWFGDAPITILEVDLSYHARGCPCLRVQAEVFVNDDRAFAGPGDAVLVPPVTVDTSCLLRVAAVFRPPVPEWYAYQCDHGIYEVVVQYSDVRAQGPQALREFFQYKGDRVLTPTHHAGEVPRLSDRELALWLQRGNLSPEEHAEFKSYPPSTRYLAASRDGGALVPEHVATKLRGLLHHANVSDVLLELEQDQKGEA